MDGSGRKQSLTSRPGAGRTRHERTLALTVLSLAVSTLTALAPDLLISTGAVPAHISGRFRDVRGFAQSDFGQFFVFDRRGHRVYGIDERHESVWQIVQLGPEEGRIIEPTAFSLAPDGSFVVADMPERQERVQVFSPVGFRIAGFILPQRTRPHLTYRDVVLGGIGSLHYTGSSILLSQPESGALVTEYNLRGQVLRTFGELRTTGHEDDREIHLALNTGIPMATADGGFAFVFQHGAPELRRFDSNGRLAYERHIQGREIDEVIASLPTAWTRRRAGELPLVPPTVRTAAVDRHGNVWISFMMPFTYVYDRDGDKIRTVQFRAAGVLSPSSLTFGPRGRLLVTPGLYEFTIEP